MHNNKMAVPGENFGLMMRMTNDQFLLYRYLLSAWVFFFLPATRA